MFSEQIDGALVHSDETHSSPPTIRLSIWFDAHRRNEAADNKAPPAAPEQHRTLSGKQMIFFEFNTGASIGYS